MESGFGSLKHAIEDDSHAYTDLNYRKQNTSDQNAEPTEEEQQQQQQPCTTVEVAASKATNHSTNPCKNEKRLKSANLLNNCRKRMNRLIKKVNLLKKMNKSSCTKCSLPSEIIKHTSKYLSGYALEFFKSQLQLAKIKKKGRRYSDTERAFALSLYFKSARAYDLLSKIFVLPSQRMLRYWLQRMNFNAGWNDYVFQVLKKKAETMNCQDKVCGVAFDAMSLKQGIYYNISRDNIDGFENLGEYGKSNKVATNVMVFMAKGLKRKWKQIFFFFFILV
ncbi:uncharacterized protein LOC143022259 [Oratosquilla oratoria]|uniref:uncharacterized protein LOC143022259 n=1 Tax=Oratosquilla oratoria TaxID=337810 RepID=UPI003F76C1C9